MYRRLARFNKKAPTSVKSPYIIFNPHSLEPCIKDPNDLIYITTVDPGIKNFAIRVAVYDPRTLKSKTLLLENFDLTKSIDNKNHTFVGNYGINTLYYTALISKLGEYLPYFINCHYIGIESQLPINYDLVRMGQHTISFFMFATRDKGNRPLIIEMDPKMKSHMLGAPPKMTKPQLKKWAHKKGVEFLKADGEIKISYIIASKTKGDDYGDVICYEKCILLLLGSGIARLPMPSLILEEKVKTPNDCNLGFSVPVVNTSSSSVPHQTHLQLTPYPTTQEHKYASAIPQKLNSLTYQVPSSPKQEISLVNVTVKRPVFELNIVPLK